MIGNHKETVKIPSASYPNGRTQANVLSRIFHANRNGSVLQLHRRIPSVGFRDAANEGKPDSRTLSRSSHEGVEGILNNLRVGIGSRVRELESRGSERHGDFRIGRRVYQRVRREVSKKGSEDLRIGGNRGGSVGSGSHREAFDGSGTGERFVQHGEEVGRFGLGKGPGSREKKEVVHGVAHHADFGDGRFQMVPGTFFDGESQLYVALRHREGRFEFVGDVPRVRALALGQLFDGADDLARERKRYEKQHD